MSTRIVPKNTVEQNPRDLNFVSDPYSLYRKWHADTSPVFWQDYGFWCLISYDSVNRVLRDRRFARLPPTGIIQKPTPDHLRDFAAAEKYSLLAMEPPAHTRLRQRVNRAFVSRQIDRLAPAIEATAHACIDRFQADGKVELLRQYATPIPLNVITRLLGVPESSGPDLVAWSHAMVRVYTLSQTRKEEELANQAAFDFQAFLRDVIEDKRKHPSDDLLSHLLALDDESEPITDEEIISVTILLLNAGHEASVHQLGNATYTLLREYPGHRRAELLDALSDDQRADDIVAECLRFAAPLHLFTRFAQEALTLDGGPTLARGDQVGLLLAAANRCPRRFDQPNRFIPGRADAAHLSLGAGIHYCVGAHLSRLELRIALQVLFERLPALSLVEHPQYQDAFHFHGLQALHVHW
ncbi:MAG: cytochrome P450 [Granulosicoccus sp.]